MCVSRCARREFYIPRWHTPKSPSFRANGRFDRVFLTVLFIRESKPRKSIGRETRFAFADRGKKGRSFEGNELSYHRVLSPDVPRAVLIARRLPNATRFRRAEKEKSSRKRGTTAILAIGVARATRNSSRLRCDTLTRSKITTGGHSGPFPV